MHLLAVIVFVIVEDMDSAGAWAPSAMVLRESGRILASEVGPCWCLGGSVCRGWAAVWHIRVPQAGGPGRASLGAVHAVHGRALAAQPNNILYHNTPCRHRW